jgi:hypothetical protein
MLMSRLAERWLGKRLCCFGRPMATAWWINVDVRSGHGDEAIERCRETQTFMTGFNAEFVAPAAQGAALLLAF